MVPAESGTIVNLSYRAAQKHIGNAIYGIAKAATDQLTSDTTYELMQHGVAVVSPYPGLVRTESVLVAAALARELGVVDVDVRSPAPLAIDDA